MPPLLGNLDHSDFFVYAACDTKYFDDFGKVLVNSIQQNSNNNIHLHLFNPRDDQIEFCKQKNVSLTYEYVTLDAMSNAANRWASAPADPAEKLKYDRIITSMSKGSDTSIIERIQKTYFACARFIRLASILKPGQPAFAIDVDAVVRSTLPPLSGKDFYLHHITGRKARFLAGGIYLTGAEGGDNFLKEYAALLQHNLDTDYIYWGLDQDLMDSVVPKYNYGGLPITYIDWDMRSESYIWTAKGSRKDLEIFVNEQKKYIS